MRVKNNKETSDTWAGMTIAAAGEYDLQASEIFKWQSDDKVIADLTSGDLLIGDGVNYKSGASDAVNFLIGADTEPRDVTGRKIVRSAITNEGWAAQFHALSFQTSKLNSVYNKDENGNDLGFTSLKLYDANGAEITDAQNEASAVKTVVDWQPNHDFDIVGGQLFQAAAPSEDVYLWVIALPGILNLKFSQGGVNLKLSGGGGIADFDGRASKFMPYNGGMGTNKFRLVIKHSAGFQHELQLVLEIFKP